MKLGFDAKRLFNNRTGLGNYSRSLVYNLQSQFPQNDYHLYSPKIEQNQINSHFFDQKKFHIHSSSARIKAYWRSFSIVNDLEKTGIQLYHGLSNEIPHHLDSVGIKSIVTIHDLIFKHYPNTYSLSERIIYDKKFRHACHNADTIIAISENTKKDIIEFYKIEEQKIKVIYQNCQPNFYQLQSTETVFQNLLPYTLPENFFLYLGSVESRKNLKLIIEAYRIKKGEINAPLVIVGRGKKYKKECQNLIEHYKLNNHFIWFDSLENNLQLQSIIQKATALIYPSYYEGFGLPIAEALLCKTAVIAADTSSLREAGGPNSIYIDPNNAIEMADAMIEIQNRPEKRLEMVQSGFKYAKELFGPEKIISTLHKLYEETIHKD